MKKVAIFTDLEKIALVFFIVLFAISVGLLGSSSLLHSNLGGTPTFGGTFTEALVGQPQFINPILSSSSDNDRDISSLIYSSLMKYNEEGELTFDLAEDFTTQDRGKKYRFFLRKNILWHDGQPFTVDDVIFTIKAVQNPLYRSSLSINWQGVDIQKIDDYTIEFSLKNVYAPFISNTTLAILPKHIWDTIDPTDFRKEVQKLKPIGTGPYLYGGTKKSKDGKVAELSLIANQSYYHRKAFIKKVVFKFYDTEEAAKSEFLNSRVDAYAFLSADISDDIINHPKSRLIQPTLPRYFALFFNQQQSQALQLNTVRQALASAIDKNELISNALMGNGTTLDSPIPSYLVETRQDISTYPFDPSLANQLLDESNLKDSDNDGIREFNAQPFSITISTPDLPELVRVADLVQTMWHAVGVQSVVKPISIHSIVGSTVRTRNYDVLLFGQVLGHEPDPFSFWHSSQIKDPGLNLALYQNPQVDALLEEARQTLDLKLRNTKYQEFSNVLMNDVPAIFLYTPVFTYIVDNKIQGINVTNINIPTERFANISNWYMKTK